MKLKKLLVDMYLASNLGDDLFLDILANKFKTSNITLNYYNSDYDEFIANYNNINRRQFSILDKISSRLSNDIQKDRQTAKSFDALVFIGGSIFMENNSYHRALYNKRMSLAREFGRLSKPIYVLGANFGPYSTVSFYNEYLAFFELCSDVCFRDYYSYNLFSHLPQVRYAPDIVFQLSPGKYKTKSTKKLVGFSIIDVRKKKGLSEYYEDYIRSTIKSIEVFQNLGYECCLMSFCSREGDLKTINTIVERLSQKKLEKVVIYNYQGDIGRTLEVIATCELFIAARFHGTILSLVLDTGIIPVIYNEKTTNVLKDINLDQLIVEMENIQLQYDLPTIQQGFNNKLDIIPIKKESEKHFQYLSEYCTE
ncbi:polysaccharide pyruvyl transferase family protein [Guptibacillus spartinae]|uniref:polysaccharide pyruvyl transferase family protein n=1 Tax=Guptibacillus spartinae TaxID=3025679 RepID=UPI0023613E04|nr:polysaccharide pyruvyl transferase family protein [Pseudalkalibacillus spartinae]